MKYLKRFNESITEDEYNRILDKISELGIGSLTNDEKSKLDNFDGKFDKERVDDVIIRTDHGTWSSDDINPKYLPDYKKSVSSDENEKTPKLPIPKKPTPKQPVKKTLSDDINHRWDRGNGFYSLYKNDEVLVLLEKYLKNGYRIYYIIFRRLANESNCRVLKMVYNTNKNTRKIDDNFEIFDNNNNKIAFNDLDTTLGKYDINFGTFNNAWYYIEDYNNR
jgi:hypothetical protein